MDPDQITSMAQSDAPTVATGEASAPASPPDDAESNVFCLSPSTEAAVPDIHQADTDSSSILPTILQRMLPMIIQYPLQEFYRFYRHQNHAERTPDWAILSPDAFPTREAWASTDPVYPGQPAKDLKVIDILGDGTRVDRGEAAFDRVGPLLQTAMPEGRNVCRVIIGVPELGNVDRRFAMRAVNLPGEKVLGAAPDGVFEQSHFRRRVCPGFDLARLRALWTMEEVAWRPFWLPMFSMRTTTEKPGAVPTSSTDSAEVCLRAHGRDVFYFQPSWAIVQTIPLQGDRFLFLCTLPSSSTLFDKSALRSATDFAALEEMTIGGPCLSKEHIFEILSRDQGRTARERFETLLLSKDSATELANADSSNLCQLLLLDFFRTVCDTSAALATDISAVWSSLDIPMMSSDDSETVLSDFQSGVMLLNKLMPSVIYPKLGAEHLLHYLTYHQTESSNNDDDKNTPRKHKRWLEHTAFALQADLDRVLLAMQSFRDNWTRQSGEQDARANQMQAKNIARLTLITAIFLPLSFGAELLGMQFRLRELGLILYDYLGLVVCCGLFLFILYNVVPFVAPVMSPFRPRGPMQRLKPSALLTRVWLHGNWKPIVVVLWTIFVASFIIGMTGDIPYSLVVLKWGCLAWSVFFVLQLVTTAVMGWLGLILWKKLGWNMVG